MEKAHEVSIVSWSYAYLRLTPAAAWPQTHFASPVFGLIKYFLPGQVPAHGHVMKHSAEIGHALLSWNIWVRFLWGICPKKTHLKLSICLIQYVSCILNLQLRHGFLGVPSHTLASSGIIRCSNFDTCYQLVPDATNVHHGDETETATYSWPLDSHTGSDFHVKRPLSIRKAPVHTGPQLQDL